MRRTNEISETDDRERQAPRRPDADDAIPPPREAARADEGQDRGPRESRESEDRIASNEATDRPRPESRESEDRISAPREVTRREGAHDLRAWGDRPEPGRFEYVTDVERGGRPVSAEGWLNPTDEERSRLAKSLQRESTRGIGPASEGSRWEGGHLIAHRHGGESCKENIAPMDSRQNNSYVGFAEREIDRLLGEGKQVYVRSTLEYGEDSRIPRTVRHEIYTPRDDSHDPREVATITTRVDHSASMTRANAEARFPADPSVKH